MKDDFLSRNSDFRLSGIALSYHRTGDGKCPGILNVVQNTAQGLAQYLKEHPANYQGQVDTLLELLYEAFTEYNSIETPAFKEVIYPLKEKLRALVETDEEADEYMDIVFSLCAAYERQGYIEGIKVGARLMIELMEPMGPIELVEPMKPMED